MYGSGLGWQRHVSSSHEARQCDADRSFWKQAAGLWQMARVRVSRS